MMHFTRLFCLITVFASISWSQLEQLYSTPPKDGNDPMYMIKNFTDQGVDVSINPFDDFTREWGIAFADIQDVARVSTESAGWKIRSASPNQIVVTIHPVKKEAEDLFSFKIEVVSGINSDENVGTIGSVRAMKVVNIKKNDSKALESTVQLLTNAVALKFRRELMKMRFGQRREEPKPSESINEKLQ